MKPDEQLPSQPIQTVGGTEIIREQDKVMLVLSYLGILALIPLLTVKDSPYVQWHAKNGLVLGIGGGVVTSILVAIIGAIPFIGLLACTLWPALIVLHILAISKALKGIRWRVPGVSDIADRF
jgi:fumarate reductase subunit D